jgi:GNAT superfamily N-acetyltransferase
MRLVRLKGSHPGLLDEVGRLRAVVWAAEGVSIPGTVAGSFAEGFDETSDHYVCLDGDSIVGAARLSVHQSISSIPLPPQFQVEPTAPAVFLSRLVVHPAHQRQGLGCALIDHIVRDADAAQVPSIVAFTTVPWVGKHLRKRGFATVVATEVDWGDKRKPAELLLKQRSLEATVG